MQHENSNKMAKIVLDLEESPDLDSTKDNRKRIGENMVPTDNTKKFKQANAEETRTLIGSIVGEAMRSFGEDAASASMLVNMDKSQTALDSSDLAVQTLTAMFNQLTENDANLDPTERVLKKLGNMFLNLNNVDKTLKPVKTVQKRFADMWQILEVMFTAIKQVLELPENTSQHPRWFIKLLLKSDLSDGSFLGLPKEMRKEHLPMHNESLSLPVILLVDEHEQEYAMDYLFTEHKFQGNWRVLYLKHRLSWGDGLIFYQVGQCKFKVHIVRRRIDGTAGDSNLGILDNTHEAGSSRLSCDCTPTPDQPVLCNTSSSALPTRIQDLESQVLDFENVKGFEDFMIYVNGEILNLKLPETAKMKYYELCNSQKQFLHKNIKELNGDYVVALILQTITIVDAMKAANISISPHDLECMGRNLKSFEDLGLEVGFLRVRLNKLVELTKERQSVSESKRVKLAEVRERERALGEEVLKLEELTKCVSARISLVGRLGAEVDTLEKESEQLDQAFQEVIDSAW